MDHVITRKKVKVDDTDHELVFRPFKPTDINELRRCITISYEELLAEVPAEYSEFIRKSLKQLLTEGDLADETKLSEKYHSGANKQGESFLIVAEDPVTGKLAGCIGGIPRNPFEFELVRLFVDIPYRKFGLGRQFVNFVVDYAKEHGYESVFLMCGSKSGQGLYRKLGFASYNQSGHTFIKIINSDRTFANVALLGGTHGNELIGIHLIEKVWQGGSALPKYPSFNCKTYIANEDAAKRNVRFVDRDLNRCFELEELLHPKENESNKLETKRARWLNEQLGPKCDIPCSIGKWKKENPNSIDYLIDLHSTTSNMGICLITLAGDPFTLRLAGHLRRYFEKEHPDLKFNVMIDFDCQRKVNNNIDSVTPSAICIEVGPLPHGTLNNVPLITGTKVAVEQTLSFIHEFNTRASLEPKEIQGETFSAYTLWKPVNYPKSNKDGYVVDACLHPSLIDKDFEEIKKGDPLFIDMNTQQVVETYEESEPAFPCFIGEAAYFNSGIALWLCKKKDVPIYT